jgi:hypothetical protein
MGFVARALAGASFAVMCVAAAADEPAVYAPGGVALSGYDAVSYFEQPHPVRGFPQHAIRWRGATWYFASPESLTAFEMNPSAYAPQFGGYCTYSVARGRTASAAPDAYVLIDGRLYLMHTAEMLEDMRDDMPVLIEEAQSHWPAALGQD